MSQSTLAAPAQLAGEIAAQLDRPIAYFRTWIDSRFAGQRGFLCLGYIDGDPQIEDLRQKWYVYPLEAQRAAADLADYAARGFNLYMAPCLFSERTRKYTYALPSIWLWADDVPASTPCTDLVRTSEGSRQAWAQLDRPLSASDRKRLQSVWQQKLGADTCTSNAVHMGRVPGGYNRKRHGKFLVYVEQHTERIYSADLLLSKAPAAPAHDQGRGEIADLDMPQVEQHLANIDALLLSGRAQQIKPGTQSARILAGEMLIFPVKNRQDDSRSMNGYVLGNGFYMRGFPDDEIAAVMFYHYRKWGVERDKGTVWCKLDIGRSIARMHAEKPGVVQSPTRYRKLTTTAEPITDTPAASRARHDRPRQLDPLMLFNRYTSDPTLCELSRKPRAAALGISTATLDRLDAALRCEDLIDIDRPGRGLPGRVVILGGVINIPVRGVLSGQPVATAPDAPRSALECAEVTQAAPQCIGETHQAPTPPSPPDARAATAPPARGASVGVCSPQAPAGAPRPKLADAVREVFDRLRVDQDTGERRRIYSKHVREALAEMGNWPASVVERAIEDERQRRRIAAIVADIQGMTPGTLRAQLRLMERLADKSRAEGTNLYRYAEWAAREMRAELATRPAEAGRKPRKNCEALPNLRAAGEQQQADLWQVAERGLAELRAHRAAPAPEPAHQVDYAAEKVNLLARLYARQAGQAVAQ